MIVAEPALNKDGESVWLGKFRAVKFWQTVRDDEGAAVGFESKIEAEEAARKEWWARVQ
jgi:hypothetical protein